MAAPTISAPDEVSFTINEAFRTAGNTGDNAFKNIVISGDVDDVKVTGLVHGERYDFNDLTGALDIFATPITLISSQIWQIEVTGIPADGSPVVSKSIIYSYVSPLPELDFINLPSNTIISTPESNPASIMLGADFRIGVRHSIDSELEVRSLLIGFNQKEYVLPADQQEDYAAVEVFGSVNPADNHTQSSGAIVAVASNTGGKVEKRRAFNLSATGTIPAIPHLAVFRSVSAANIVITHPRNAILYGLLRYEYRRVSPNEETTWTSNGLSTTIELTGLTDVDYVYEVRPVGPSGASAATRISFSGYTSVSPSAPRADGIGFVDNGSNSYTFNFRAPLVAGASPITRYEWKQSTETEMDWRSVGLRLSFTATITTAVPFDVEIRAVNSDGNGEILTITVAAPTPSAVRNLGGNVTRIQAGTFIRGNLSFLAPAQSGLSRIIRYEARCNRPVRISAHGSIADTPNYWINIELALSHTLFIDGGVPGAITIDVRAVNSHGAGPYTSVNIPRSVGPF